ncbi:hypothetical protein NL520_27215, partial [Klebsiella pneumoniae]|nr:hypothetical protein [Klebsiella pneumoniae]
GTSFDDLGGGHREGQPELVPAESGASKSVQLLKQISSTGYLRKRMPQELMVLQGGVSTVAMASGMAEEAAVFETTTVSVAMDARTKAKMHG